MNEHSLLLHKLALFDRIGYSLVDRRIQNLLIIVFKTINNYPPEHLRDLFRLWDIIKNLRGLNKLQVPKHNTTRYGKKSVKYLAAITWNKISDTLRWLDWIFGGWYLPTLSINYVGMSKDMEEMLPQLYYIKMKMSYDLGFIAIGVAMAT